MSEAYQPVRLSLSAAERELRLSRTTIRARLADTQPGEDGCYSLIDVVEAVYGDVRTERLRLTREQADYQALKNAEMRRELLPVEEVRRGIETLLAVIKSLVTSDSDLPERTKKTILERLAQDEIECLLEQQYTGV